MGKKRRFSLSLRIVALVVLLAVLGWFLNIIFEGERPEIQIRPLPDFISGARTFSLTATDRKRGLRDLEVSVNQEGRKVSILKKAFPFEGLLNSKGAHRFETKFTIDPQALNLAQGRVDLKARAWDYSRRRGGDGNLSLLEHKMLVDTIPPAIRAVTRMHNINVGGSGLIVYQTSSDTVESGLFVNRLFFPGFPEEARSQAGFHVCYFAVSPDTKALPSIYLWAKDRAGNTSKAGFYKHIRRRRFRKERINITDMFLERILPYFSFYHLENTAAPIDQFLKINRDLRRDSGRAFYGLRAKTSPKKLWDGPFLRLKNAATMARFADHRQYYYKGKKVDEQVHLGVDLASVGNSEVQAANNGRVVFADRLGIYGLAVVLDHGQGVASVYGHLSHIGVKPGREVKKGEVIGRTGQTGLAGGDHLHFGVLINGVFVNPIEWWDAHWLQDNIENKLAMLKR